MNTGFKGGTLTVKAGGKLGHKGESDTEAEDERPVALGLAEDHLGEGPSHHWDHHFELGK